MGKEQADLIVHSAAELLPLTNAGAPVVGEAFKKRTVISDGAVAIAGGKIVAVGNTEVIRAQYAAPQELDATGKVVIPGLIDCHTHLVYAGSRQQEYEAKLAGVSYAEQQKKKGGIHYTVEQTRKASFEELLEKALRDLDLMLLYGTTTVEAKSGYGLNGEDERKILRVLQEADKCHPVEIVFTYLGAHTIPLEYQNSRRDYIEFVKSEIPNIAARVDFVDVWVDPLGYTAQEAREIAEVVRSVGLKLKLHIEQTGSLAGGELAAELKAVSADHLDFITETGMRAMAAAGVVGVLLPGVTFHLREFQKKIPVARMIENGMALALATDYNPGSCPSQSMQMIMQCAARLYGMGYSEILHAATINAAFAIGRADRTGSLQPGKSADLVLLDVPSFGEVINCFGVNLVHSVIKRGAIVVSAGQRLNIQRD